MTFADRLRRVLPQGWFSDADPVLDALLAGFAAVWDVLQSQVNDTRAQARLLTATGDWLAARVGDYLPPTFRRRSNETDEPFAQRASAEILRPRATRPALERLLTDEGATPFGIFEPGRPADTGGYGVAMGYDVGGAYGSLLTPNQVFLDVTRPYAGGIASTGGYGIALGYDSGGGAWRSKSEIKGGITEGEFMASVASVMPAGGTAWVRFVVPALVTSPLGGVAPLDEFLLDQNTLS